MKKIFSVVAAAMLATALMAQEAVITFEKESHDFGRIQESDGRVTTVFNFKNEGMSPLVLSNVRASCGCTTPKWTREPIEPGATGAITVTYNPNGRPGKFSKTITVTSNATEPTKRLYIKGEVIPKPAQPVNKYPAKIGDLSLATKQLDFGDVLKGQSKTINIEYANQTDKVITLEASQSEFVSAVVTLAEIQPKQSGQLAIILDANICPIYGPVKERIYLKVNGKTENSEAYAITLTANVREDFSKLTEAQRLNAPIADIAKEINLGVLPAGKAKVSKTLPLSNAGVNPLYIRRVIAADDMIFPVVKNGLKSGKRELKFVVNTTKMASTKYQRGITIITNDPRNPIQTIKLTWEVR
ncbi:MAG: DUF1573 domain-containing protein [Paludibacteraceae bacterium]|nr:DUF1573 domain-containing protein [Paludibacteraceae bacterium]